MAEVRVYYINYHRKPGGYFSEEHYNEERARKLYAQYLRSNQKEDVTFESFVVFRDIPELDRFLTWWTNYYARAIGKKISWKWKAFRAGMETAHAALAYRDRGYIAYCPVQFYKMWKHGQREHIKDIVAHEVMHFRVPGEIHGPRFQVGMTQWTGATHWPWVSKSRKK